MTNTPAETVEREGPQIVRETVYGCQGCKHLRTKDWEFYGEDDEIDRGTDADCIAADRPIASYWNDRDSVPDWCPHPIALTAPAPSASVAGDAISARPLFWRKSGDHPQDSGQWVADGISGRYSAEKQRDGTWLLWWAHDNFVWEKCGSFAEVKAKAEADWQKRFAEKVLAALPSKPDAPDRVTEGEPIDAVVAQMARTALGAYLAWPDAARDGPVEVGNGKTYSWLQGLPDRLATPARLLEENEALRRLAHDLALAEAEYRAMHDLHGDDSKQAGRAWDLMRRAGDAARAALGGETR